MHAMPFAVTDPLGSAAWAFLVLQPLLVWGAWRSRVALDAGEELPPAAVLYPSIAIQGLVLLAFALAAAWDAGIGLRPGGQSWALALVWGPLVLLALLGSAPLLWRLTPPGEREQRAAMLPRTSAESSLALVVSLVAEMGEEIV